MPSGAVSQCAESAHLANDRFRLWTGPEAHERLGDVGVARPAGKLTTAFVA